MKKWIALTMIACMALSMVACGSTNDKPAETPTTEEAPAAETQEPEAGSEDVAGKEAAASEGKTWIIAMDTVFRPFEFTDEKGNFVGIDVDILKAVAEDQGFQYEIQSLGWDAAVAAVQAGQADGLLAGASITEERKSNGWIFSDGYYDATQTLAVAKDSGIQKFEDLKGKNVATKNGTEGAKFAESIKDKYGFTTTVFEDSPTMYQDVVMGNSAACAEDTPIMADSIKTGGLAMEIPEGMQSESGASYGFAIMKADNQELLDLFNAGLKNIKENGTYDKIIANYLGE